MLTRPEAVTLALYELDGERDSLDTEDIALKVGELAPGMFSWQKHPDRIDKELVRVALSDARLKGRLVVGSHSRGWMLTTRGLEFARRKAAGTHMGQQPTRRTKEDVRWERERARLLSTPAFAHFIQGRLDNITADDVDAFFRLNVYVRGAARAKKLATIENRFATDPDLGPAVRKLAARARERN